MGILSRLWLRIYEKVREGERQGSSRLAFEELKFNLKNCATLCSGVSFMPAENVS